MAVSKSTQWIRGPVNPYVMDWAKDIRALRDAKYKNSYPEKDGDMRHLGEVGEICLFRWLTKMRAPCEWVTLHPAGFPDFRIGDGVTVDMKTRKWKIEPNETMEMGVKFSHVHANNSTDWFFFATYHEESNILTFAGAMHREEMKKAKVYTPGQRTANGSIQRTNESTYETTIAALLPPVEWLAHVMDW